ncbi:MAG: GntR family transcriptional regulator [Desulfuromonadales bacterium GWD2_61_12]|nr:MAG: GntR family transcriptional regulator [Desulfuromonadales bacterium GWD2_61_12]
MKTKPMESQRTLRQSILETIREAILDGHFKPGEKIAEPELAERFGVSRTPIREAFRQLEAEGHLTVIPRRGAVVTNLSNREAEEIDSIKSVLEGYAARLAVGKISPKDYDRLEGMNARLQQLARTGDVKTFIVVHDEFHELFIRAAGNDKLCALVGELLRKLNRQRMAALALPGRMELAVQEHLRILEAFRRQDGDRADDLVRQHAA